MVQKCHPYAKVHPNAAAAVTTWGITGVCAEMDFPTKQSGRGTHGIICLGGGYVPADIQKGCDNEGVPYPNIIDVLLEGMTNAPGGPDDVELALDLETFAASYHYVTGERAEVRIYFCQNIQTGVSRAARDGCATLGCSWGCDEAEYGKPEAVALQAAIVAANDTYGMVFLGCAGDNDSSDGGSTPANCDCPGSCPNTVCGGGTSLPKSGYKFQTVWNDNPGQTDGEGTGGGFSIFFAAPAWQTANGMPKPPTGLGRMVPDFAVNADPNTGYRIYCQKQDMVVGGTSVFPHLMAGLFCGLGTKLGNINPDIWAHADAFFDIVKGKGGNGVYDALDGPDACTGMGTPIGTALAVLFS